MDMSLVDKISNLAFASYYNDSLDLVVVHFFNKEEGKSDIVAYLNKEYAWDVREILDESSSLDSLDGFLGEDITISHERVGVFQKGSDFDTFMRSAITSMMDAAKENEDMLQTIDYRVRGILENGYKS